MASSGKRKKGIAQSVGAPSPKKRKTAQKTKPEQSPDSDSETFYKVRSIIAETQHQYKIAWEPNSQTGETYKPTWEPKENANELAIEDWERQKATKAAKATRTNQESPSTTKKAKGKSRLSSSTTSPAQTKVRPSFSLPKAGVSTSKAKAKPRLQPRQEIAESELDSNSDKPVVYTPEAEYLLESVPEIDESQQHQQIVDGGESPLFVADDGANGAEPDLVQPERALVQLSNPPSSYTRGDYSRYPAHPGDSDDNASPEASDLTSSAPMATTEDAPSQASKASVPVQSGSFPVKSGSSRVIPDSQSQGFLVEDDSSFRGFSPGGTQQATLNDNEDGSQSQRSDYPDHERHASIASSIVQDQAPNEFESADAVLNGVDIQVSEDREASTAAEHSGGIGSVTLAAPEPEAEPRPSHSQLDPSLNAPVESNLVTPEATEVEAAADRTPTNSAEKFNSSASTGRSKAAATFEDPVRSPNNELTIISAEQGFTADHSAPITTASPQRTLEEIQVITVPSTANSSEPVSSSTRPPRETDFEPHTPGQRPPPSSAISTSPLRDIRASKIVRQIPKPKQAVSEPFRAESDTQSSFPFQTQLPLPDSARETAGTLADDKRTRATCLSNGTGNAKPSEPESPLSSSIPSVPSRILAGKIGESAPDQFGPLSGDTMSSSSPLLADTVRARLAGRNARREAEDATQDAAAQQPASRSVPVHPGSEFSNNIGADVALASPSLVALAVPESLRSPSAIPAIEVEPISTREEMTSSRRYSTLQPDKSPESELPSKADHLNRVTTRTTEEEALDPELASVHVVPVALLKAQRDPYECALRSDKYRSLIERAISNQVLDGGLLSQANALIDELRDIALHPDLTNPETVSQTAEASIQAAWDVNCSAKFSLIKDVLGELRNSSLHVAIVARGPRVPNMLENFVCGLEYPCYRYGSESSTFDDSPGFKITVADLDAGTTESNHSVDVIIAVDALVDPRHAVVRALRSRKNGWSSLLTLVVPRTVEHIERCLQTDISAPARTRLLLKAIHELRCGAGRLESTQTQATVAATLIAEFVKNPQEGEWPLAGLTQLEDIDSQTETDLDNSLLHSSGNKRPHDEMSADSGPVKRLRLSPGPQTVNPQDLNMTHISDSMEHDTQSNNVANSSLLAQTVTEQRLKEALEAQRGRCEEFVRDLEDLQYRYEDQRKNLQEVTRERDAAIRNAGTVVDRMRGAEANNVTLRTERTTLKEALSAAKDALQNHTIPERHEFETLRAHVEAAQVEKEKAEKRVKATEKDLEWTRSMYQESSQRARELNEQVKDLETRLSEALVKASGESARAREISIQAHNKALEQENQKLRLMIKSREMAIKFKDDEMKSLKEVGRGRLGTRQGSVPRSPRMGSPVKGRGSRAASPAVGDARGKSGTLHPLRQS